MNLWNTVYKFAVAALVVLLGIGIIVAFAPKYQALRQLQRRKAVLEEENHKLQSEILELKLKQQSFQSDPLFIERTARELGMARSNEIIYKIHE